MNQQTVRANLLLLLAAIIWGSTFVAQKIGMGAIGPFWFSAIRFSLGLLVILPLVRRERCEQPPKLKHYLIGICVGLLLFVGINLQQVGLQFTSLANAGFITGTSVVLVPLIGLLLGHRYRLNVWCGVGLSIIGLYLISVKAGVAINPGDLLMLVGALVWALHVISLSGFGHALPPVRLALTQFTTCAVLSGLVALFTEPISLAGVQTAAIPLLYGGIMSVGIAFTIQVIAQRHAKAAHSAVILSLEAVVAALAGWVILHEALDERAIFGCALMLAGTIMAQLTFPARRESATAS